MRLALRRHEPANNYNFKLKGTDFTVHGFRMTGSRVFKHRLIYAANRKAVLSENLDKHIPNLGADQTIGTDGGSFVYLAVVQSQYLNDRVNGARTDFDLTRDEDGDANQ